MYETGGTVWAFDFRFYSEEFPEFVGSEFNDAFLAELDANTWSIDATNFSNPVVAPANFAFVPGPTPVPIEVNTAGPAAMTAENAAGTTYDGATRLLTAQKAVSPGQHSLYFTIFDQGDSVYDSTVVIDRLRVEKKSSCTAGVQASNKISEYRSYYVLKMSGALPADASFSTPNDEWAFRTGRALGSDSNDSYFCLGTYNVAGCNPANPDTSRLEAAVILHFGSTTIRCLRSNGTYRDADPGTINCPAGTTFKWFYSSKGAQDVAQFFSPEEVTNITQSFAYGFTIGSGPDRNLTSATPYSPHLLLMIGTPNGPENMALRTGCGGIATACGGQQLWNRVVEVRRGPASIQQSYRAMIAYQNRIIVRGAIDVEQGRDAPTKFCFTPNCFAETSALTGGYTAAASADPNGSWYVNYGACDGCSEDPDALINNTNNIFTTKPTADFTHQNIGQLATYKAFVAPQLYNENARNAKQWAALSKGWNSRRVRPPIIGPPTQSSSLYFAIGIVSQTGVCNSIPAGCPGTARQGTDSVVDLETSLGQPIVRRVLNFYNSPTSL